MAARRQLAEPDPALSHYTGPAVKEVRGRAKGWDAVVLSQVDKEFS
jgi:ribosomal protein L14E/L6E/L27E